MMKHFLENYFAYRRFKPRDRKIAKSLALIVGDFRFKTDCCFFVCAADGAITQSNNGVNWTLLYKSDIPDEMIPTANYNGQRVIVITDNNDEFVDTLIALRNVLIRTVNDNNREAVLSWVTDHNEVSIRRWLRLKAILVMLAAEDTRKDLIDAICALTFPLPHKP